MVSALILSTLLSQAPQDPGTVLKEQLTSVEEKVSAGTQTLEEVQDEVVAIREAQDQERQIAAENAERRERARQALQTAQNALSSIRPDVLHDSSSYAHAIDTARFALQTANDLAESPELAAASDEFDRASSAFSNKDLQWTWNHAQQTLGWIAEAEKELR